jgi:hypothetical protein
MPANLILKLRPVSGNIEVVVVVVIVVCDLVLVLIIASSNLSVSVLTTWIVPPAGCFLASPHFGKLEGGTEESSTGGTKALLKQNLPIVTILLWFA